MKGGSVFQGRQRRLRAAIKGAGFDALVVSNPKDIRYLTGFHGEDSMLFVALSGKPVILSDFRFEEDLAEHKDAARIHIRGRSSFSESVEHFAGKAGAEIIALQAEHISFAARNGFAKALGAKRIKASAGLVSKLREIKDDSEIALIRKAVRIQQDALDAVLPELAPGMTEREAALMLDFAMRERGAQGPSFPIIMAARANGSKPHAVPGKTKLARNKPVLIDWGALHEGYCSDMTRTFTLGRWPKAVAEIYDIVHEAYEAGVAAVAPGVRACDVDAASRAVIEDAGFGPRFGHSLGHGIGLDVHEQPGVNSRNTNELEPGHVITIEPGIYLPGVGGVRLENDILVTERGGKNLCSMPMDRRWATLA